MPKGARRLEGFNDRIVALYARGMTVRDIQAHLAELYDVDVSPDLISKVTAAVLDDAKEWQARPLEPVYAAIYLDAISCKVRDQGVVARKAAYLAVGIDPDGFKDSLRLRPRVCGRWLTLLRAGCPVKTGDRPSRSADLPC